MGNTDLVYNLDEVVVKLHRSRGSYVSGEWYSDYYGYVVHVERETSPPPGEHRTSVASYRHRAGPVFAVLIRVQWELHFQGTISGCSEPILAESPCIHLMSGYHDEIEIVPAFTPPKPGARAKSKS